jgi:hypothetical protein
MKSLFEPSSSIYLENKAFLRELLNGSLEFIESKVYDQLQFSYEPTIS